MDVVAYSFFQSCGINRGREGICLLPRLELLCRVVSKLGKAKINEYSIEVFDGERLLRTPYSHLLREKE